MALTDKLKNIANAIRTKTGKADGLTLDAMPNEILSISGSGSAVINTKTYTVTLSKVGGWVFLTSLDADVLEHINDDTLIVSFIRMSEYTYEYYTTSMALGCNTIVGYRSGSPRYGVANRTQTEAIDDSLPIMTPANNTDSARPDFGGFRIDGSNYYYRAGDGYVHSGTYRLTFTW